MYHMISDCINLIFFFFQAEDGIRDLTVTGVQTCALPICQFMSKARWPRLAERFDPLLPGRLISVQDHRPQRSESVRRGHARRSRGLPCEIGRASCRERV